MMLYTWRITVLSTGDVFEFQMTEDQARAVRLRIGYGKGYTMVRLEDGE